MKFALDDTLTNQINKLISHRHARESTWCWPEIKPPEAGPTRWWCQCSPQHHFSCIILPQCLPRHYIAVTDTPDRARMVGARANRSRLRPRR